MLEEEEIQVHQRGRSRVVIREDQLCFLLENGFRINDIAASFSAVAELLSEEWLNYQ